MKSIIQIALAASLILGLVGCAANVKRTSGANGAVRGGTFNAAKLPAEAARKLVLNVSPTGASVGSADWPAFRDAWRSAFAAEAAARGIPFEIQDGEVRPLREPGTLVAVQVSDYRYLSTTARMFGGIMTGNAFVIARLRYLDLTNGREFDEQQVNTTSSAWEGAFSAMTDKQLQALAKETVQEIKP